MSRALSPGRMMLMSALVDRRLRDAGLEHRARCMPSASETGDDWIQIVEVEGGVPASYRRANPGLDQSQSPLGTRFRAIRALRRGPRQARHDPPHAPTPDPIILFNIKLNFPGSALRRVPTRPGCYASGPCQYHLEPISPARPAIKEEISMSGMGSRMIRGGLAAIFLLLLVEHGHADDSGTAELQRCKICHSLDQGGANRIGPNLFGVFGRKAGATAGFNYSAPMKDSGLVWDDETMAKFLRDPRATIHGNRMSFPGIKDEGVLADLLARLRQATQ